MTTLDRSAIDPDADRTVRKLARAGFKAYLVGGCVRDILVGKRPKDFDVATSATPNEIRGVFRNCRIIGRRFRLAHVFFGDKIIETSTFRANPRDDEGDGDGGADLLIRRDNVFGSETEDARRRDFTINGLFYDVEKETVIDHVDGLPDLEAKLVRTIGDPDIRFQEDPIRMLRAIKFAARLDFAIEPVTYRALIRWRGEIRKCAPPRVLEEIYRLLRGGAARRSMELLVETGILPILSTHLAALLEGPGAPPMEAAMAETENPEAARRAVRRAELEAEVLAATGAEDEDVPEIEPNEPDTDSSDFDEGDEDDGEVVELDDEERQWRQLWADDAQLPRAGHIMPIARPIIPDGDGGLATRRQAAWAALSLIDAAMARRIDPSNAAVISAVLAPYVVDDLATARPSDLQNLILDCIDPIVVQLRVPRRDAERMRQLFMGLRRLVAARGRAAQPDLLGSKDFIDDAMLLFDLTERSFGREGGLAASGHAPRAATAGGDGEADADGDGADAGEADGEAGADGDDPDQPRKRRRRRRGGRRQRREDGSTGNAS